MGDGQDSEPPDEGNGTAVTAVCDVSELQEEYSYLTEPQRAYLTVLAGPDVGRMYALKQGDMTLGRSNRADIRIDDDRISRKHLRIRMFGLNAIAEDMGSSNGTYLNGTRITASPMRDGDKLRLAERTTLRFALHDAVDEQFQLKMYDAALRDPLTNAFNRRYLLDQLQTEMAYVLRHEAPMSLVLFDIDHFKRINDQHGHVAGDQVLVRLSGMIAKSVRTEDLFARYGGDEFACLCRGIDLAGAHRLAERMRGAAEGNLIRAGEHRLHVTISAGVAEFDAKGADASQLVEHADAALYRAKRLGRNQVVGADGSWPLPDAPASGGLPELERL